MNKSKALSLYEVRQKKLRFGTNESVLVFNPVSGGRFRKSTGDQHEALDLTTASYFRIGPDGV